MNTPDHNHTFEVFSDHLETLAQQWLRALAPASPAPASAAGTQQTLALAAKRLLLLLHDEVADPHEARAVGATLVRLGYTSPDALSATLDLLARKMAELVPCGPGAAISPRITVALGMIAAGFAQQLQAQLLAAQDDLRRQHAAEISGLLAKLRLCEHYRHTILSHAPLILLVVDSAGRITLAEGKLPQRLRCQQEHLIGSSIFDVARNHPDILEYARGALGGESFLTVIEIHGRVFEAYCKPLQHAGDKRLGAVFVALDVTTRARREAELLQVRKQVADEHARWKLQVAQQLEAEAADLLGELQALLDQATDGGQAAPAKVAGAARRADAQLSRIRQTVLSAAAQLRSPERGTRPAAPAQLEVELTPGEGEVLRLLASGQSNRQIGGALGISAKAVEKRLGKIYAKLGVATRAEAVALVIRGGLV